MDWDKKSKVLVFFLFLPASHCTRGRKTTTLFRNLHETVINYSGIVLEKKLCRLIIFVSEPAFFWCKKKPNMIHQLTPCGSWHGSLGIRSDHRGTGISSPFDTSSNSSKESSPVDMAKMDVVPWQKSQMILFCSQLKEFGVRFCLFVCLFCLFEKNEKVGVIRPCLNRWSQDCQGGLGFSSRWLEYVFIYIYIDLRIYSTDSMGPKGMVILHLWHVLQDIDVDSTAMTWGFPKAEDSWNQKSPGPPNW